MRSGKSSFWGRDNGETPSMVEISKNPGDLVTQGGNTSRKIQELRRRNKKRQALVQAKETYSNNCTPFLKMGPTLFVMIRDILSLPTAPHGMPTFIANNENLSKGS